MTKTTNEAPSQNYAKAFSPLRIARHEVSSVIAEGLNVLGDADLADKLRVSWSARMTSAAGCALYTEAEVRFSSVILPHIPHADRVNTARHELAHVAAWELYGAKGHGATWKRVMRQLGGSPRRVHHFLRNPAVIQAAGFGVIVCERCGAFEGITKRRVSTIRRGGVYAHRTCGGGTLRLLEGRERIEWLSERV